MRLSDVMSSMQLSSYAEVALLLFLGAFLTIILSVFRSRHAEEWERCRHLPLDEREDGALNNGRPDPSPAELDHECI